MCRSKLIDRCVLVALDALELELSPVTTKSGVAILDVLIPPYDELRGRDCTYYRADRVASVGAGAGAAAMGRAGDGGSWSFGGEGADAGQSGLTVRLVPCSPGDNYAVVRGDFVPPFATTRYGT